MQPSSKAIQKRNQPSALRRLPLAAAIYFALSSTAFAQDAALENEPETDAPAQAQPASKKKATTLGTVTVSAQKREENLQRVPISINAIGAVKLDALNISDFGAAMAILPAVSFDTGEGGSTTPFMRAVANGENGNHSGPQPSVGVYIDEQPITTIGGLLDVHLYDINRVEALAGPQGTLFGASSQAGTIRIITNKPDTSAFAAGYSFELNSVSHGGNGYIAEGFVNVPISKSAALRVVAWDEHDAGYIDNVEGTRTYPGWDDLSGGHGTINNSAVAEDDYNDVDTKGARAALKINLGENWTVTPEVMTQTQKTHGNFAMDPEIGDLKIQKWFPEEYDDHFTQSALTVQGKIGNFDLTYAYTHLNRNIDSVSDYSDYAFWYDAYYQEYYTSQGYANYYGELFVDDNGNFINPSQLIAGRDDYTKTSHELRISSPQENRFRFIAGYFWQEQEHKILQNYTLAGDFATAYSVTGWPDTLWLTNQLRQDQDSAFFGEISYDFTDKLTVTGGMRWYHYDNSLKGFFGFSANWSEKYGEFQCFSDEQFQGAPCVNLDDAVKNNDSIGRVNATYTINDSKLVYLTWSQGFRPGGVNRSNPTGQSPVYQPDILTNYEFGWKTSWADNTLTFNGAIFQENWEDMQFGFIPPGGAGLTVIRNAGSSRIRGFEADLNWAITYNFVLTGGLALYDGKLTTDYCGFNDAEGNPVTSCPAGTYNPDDDEFVDGPAAPKGTQLPVTARYKGNLTGRYTFDVGGLEAYVQGVLTFEGDRRSYLEDADAELYGDLDGYSLFDLSAGIRKNNWSLDVFVKNVFDERNQLSRFAGCVFACVLPDLVSEYPNGQQYLITGQPTTFGIRFSQEF